MIISKRPPYQKTTADPERTEMQINKLLRDYGISKYQWSKDFAHNQIYLNLIVEAEINGVKKEIGIKIEPPTFAAKRRTWNAQTGRHDIVFAPNWAQSYRLLYHWLKAKIEAIAYGLTTVEKEFLSQIVIQLPSGQTRTVSELLVDPSRLGKFALEQKEE